MNRLLLVLALAAAVPASAEETKISVLPFVALSGGLPPRTGVKAAGMLSSELKNLESMTLVEISPENRPDTEEAAIDDGKKLVAEGRAAEKRRKFGQAAEIYKKAVSRFEAGAARLDTVLDLADATAALATVHYRLGDDATGERELSQAVSLASARDFTGMSTSPLFTALVKKIREKVLKAQRGSVRIDSTPAGSPAKLDGVPVGRTPLVVKDVPEGRHVWRVDLPSGEAIGGLVAVTGGSTAKASGSAAPAGPQSQFAAALLKNKLDSGGAGIVKAIAKSVSTELVVFGTLFLDGKNVTFDSFLYVASKDSVVRLPRSVFDPDLLNAGLELYKLAGDLGTKGAGAGTAVKLPLTMCADNPPPEAATVSDARYSQPGEAIEAEAIEDAGPRKPVTRKPVTRKPANKEPVIREEQPPKE